MNFMGTWMGKPIDELTRDELINVLQWCMKEIEYLRLERDRWRQAGDAAKYLMADDPRRTA